MMASPPATTIRLLVEDDAERIAAAFAAQGWHKPAQQYRRYLEECRLAQRVVLVAEVSGCFGGYITIVWESDYAPFRSAGIPEIVDFNVLQKYQRRGVGTALLAAAEQQIAARSPEAGIGVGLTSDYGAAQVLYVKRGYVPDGRGAATGGEGVRYGRQVMVDDDLCLYFTKRLWGENDYLFG
jgi:GNAT superfamily N-acetyltransferase